MAVRFDTSSEFYQVNVTSSSVTSYSVCHWVKYEYSPTNGTPATYQFQTSWCMGSGTSSCTLLQTGQNLVLPYTYNASHGGTFSFAGNLTTDAFPIHTWYFIGAAVSGNAITVVWKQAGAASFQVATDSNKGGAVTFNRLYLGESAFGGEWLNGSLAAVKVWTGAALSQAELEAEASQFQPARSSNLFAYYRLASPSTTDNSGNGHTLSGGSGTAADTDPAGVPEIAGLAPPPPNPYRRRLPLIVR